MYLPHQSSSVSPLSLRSMKATATMNAAVAPVTKFEPEVPAVQEKLRALGLTIPPDAAISLKCQEGPNVIESPDSNHAEELVKPPFVGKELPIESDVAAARKWVDEVVMQLPRAPSGACYRRPLAHFKIDNVMVTYDDDQCFRIRVYTPVREGKSVPSIKKRPALVMYHGGGWIHGYPEVDEDVSKFFSSELDVVVLSVDYRLAPENKFPKPFDDSYQAIQWTVDNADVYGIDTDRIAVWGCSAGGNLAAAVTLRDAMEHEKPRICHVNLVVPLTCHPALYPDLLHAASSSVNQFGQGPLGVLAAQLLLEKYAGGMGCHDFVSVLNAKIPKNHPPAYTVVGGCDFLRDEGIMYSLRLRDADVDSQLEIMPGMPHGVNFPPTTHAARQFYINQARMLEAAYQRVKVA